MITFKGAGHETWLVGPDRDSMLTISNSKRTWKGRAREAAVQCALAARNPAVAEAAHEWALADLEVRATPSNGWERTAAIYATTKAERKFRELIDAHRPMRRRRAS